MTSPHNVDNVNTYQTFELDGILFWHQIQSVCLFETKATQHAKVQYETKAVRLTCVQCALTFLFTSRMCWHTYFKRVSAQMKQNGHNLNFVKLECDVEHWQRNTSHTHTHALTHIYTQIETKQRKPHVNAEYSCKINLFLHYLQLIRIVWEHSMCSQASHAC